MKGKILSFSLRFTLASIDCAFGFALLSILVVLRMADLGS
jgi:hypothetical protein